jgi:DNA invertase Pin-like site-specific DNA recombinase
LKEKAKEMGFKDVILIDDDLGVTGAGGRERPGFMKLLEALRKGEVGAVIALESSRLARNAQDWGKLIELCKMYEVLVIDHDGVYDPGYLNDRLMLGIKGTWNEFELGMMQHRATEVVLEMVRRGEVISRVPVGFVRTDDRRCEITPDKQVQEAIYTLFRKFDELGSARQIALWYQRKRMRFPKAKASSAGREVRWEIPKQTQILSILKNPTYAGAFVWGRHQTRTNIVDGQLRKTRGHIVPQDEWTVFLPDHHVGYISWEKYKANQERIADNSRRRNQMGKGPARTGAALLGGLLRCGRCWRKLQVSYRSETAMRYYCRIDGPPEEDRCSYSFSTSKVDEAVSTEVVEAIKPAGVQAAMAVLQRCTQEDDEETRQLRLSVEKARYEAERCRRQYDAVEPENRLVASTLEGRWNDAIAGLQKLELRLAELLSRDREVSPEERQRLLDLGADLEGVWNHPEAQPILKKRILRTVIEEIIVELHDEPSEILLRIHWKGGVHTEIRVPRLQAGQHRNATNKETVDLIRDLARICTDQMITAVLNRLGVKTGKGGTWTSQRVQKFRSRRNIPAFRPKRPRSWVTLSEAADELEVSAPTIRRLIDHSILPAHQVIRYAPWVIERSDLMLPEVQRAVKMAKTRGRLPLTQTSKKQLPLFSTVDS